MYTETFDYEYYIGSTDGVVNEPAGEPEVSRINPNNGDGNNLDQTFDDELKTGCSQVTVRFDWLGLFGGLMVRRRI